MPFHDPIGGFIEARLVERMRHLPDKPYDGVARKQGVGIKRET